MRTMPTPATASLTTQSAVGSLPSPPGPQGHWLWGSLPEYRRGRLAFVEKLRRDWGPVTAYRLGRRQFVQICEPELIDQVLVSRNRQFGKSFITKMLRDVFGMGLLTSDGAAWLQRRKLLQPTFAKPQLAAFGPAMVAQTQAFAVAACQQEKCEMLREMQELTMAIATETLLGVRLPEDVHAIHQPHDRLRQSFDRRVEGLWIPPAWLPSWSRLQMLRDKRAIDRVVDRLIADRRANGTRGPDLLSRLLEVRGEQGERLTDQEIREETLTFLFAGHETTASALAWTWYLLATHPEVEEQLQQELQTVLGGRTPTVADVPQLKFTDQIIRETLRLYPSSYSMGRVALEDCELGGYRIPQGTNVMLSQWATHRDARFYPAPEEFRPQRWTDAFLARLPHFAYFPFGGGPRVCIGNSFAMLESVLVVATIAQWMRLRLIPGQRIEPLASVTLRPSPALWMECERRA